MLSVISSITLLTVISSKWMTTDGDPPNLPWMSRLVAAVSRSLAALDRRRKKSQDGWRHERERESKPSDLVMFAGDGTKGEATPATHSVRFAASGAFYLLLRATTAAPELASLPARRLARRLGAAAGHRRRRRRRGRHGFDGDPDFPEAHISWARTRSRSRAAQ
uniref:DUF4220 domain-containing protein n=1 Tax=Oryza nivara TaxID=4536 RepID=A0A0E0JCG2_ORYNI